MSTVAGIDIGAEAIKGIVLHAASSGAAEVVAAGTLPIGELGHMEDSQDKTLALGVKLRELVKSARLRAPSRRVGASGKTTSIRYLQVPPVPPWRLDMLVNYEVEERIGDKEPNTYDYQILDVPEVAGQYTVMIGMLRETTANDLLAMGRAGGLGEVEVDLEALALYNAYFHGHGYDTDKTVLIVDIGADDLTILLCRNGGLYFARTIMGGGRRFTQVLADELKVDLEEADDLKKRQAEILFDIAPVSRTGRFARSGGATGTVPRASASLAGQSAAQKPAPPGNGAAQAQKPDAENVERPKQQNGAPSQAGSKTEAATADQLTEDILDVPPGADALSTQTPPVLPAVGLSGAEGSAPSAEATVLTSAPQGAAQPSGPAPSQRTALLSSLQLAESADEKRKRQMSNVLVREAAALCAALENVVLISKQQTKMREIKVDRVYVTGGGSRLRGLAEFMSRRMRVEVAPLEPFRQVSLDRLAPEQAAALKAEQHTLAVATGLALGGIHTSSLSFLLWPEALKQRKTFWARGAYLYYAAAFAVLALALYLYTPYRNVQALGENFETSEDAVNKAQSESGELKKLEVDNEERRAQLKQIADNTLSGHYFLTLLAELKNTQRISDDIYLTQISTNMPEVVRKQAGRDLPLAEKRDAVNALGPSRSSGRAPADPNATPETFQTQRQIYLRGFARGDVQGEGRIQKIVNFYGKLLPDPDNPDNPANLVKDIRPIWFSPEAVKQEIIVGEKKEGEKKEAEKKEKDVFYLTEFVLEAYTEGTREKTAKKDAQGKPIPEKKDATAAPAAFQAPPATPAAPAVAPFAPVLVPAPAAGGVAPAAPAVAPAPAAPVAPAVQQPAGVAPGPAAPAVPAPPDAEKRPPVKKKYVLPTAPPKAAPDAVRKKE